MTGEEAFTALIMEYDTALRRIARVHAGTDGEADDLHQEILLQLWKSYPSFKGNSKLGTWLYRVALNTALTWQRKAVSRNRRQRRSTQETEQDSQGHSSLRSQKQILADFLDFLTGPDRWVLLLYMEGLRQQEIAEITGLTESAVGVRIHRIKNAFTDRYLEP